MTFERARSLAEIGRYPEAERELRHELTGRPADPDLLTLLAFVLRMRREYPAALQACDAAIAAAPDLAAAHAERAENLILLVRDRDAVAAAAEAVRLGPHDPAGHLVLARACASARDFGRARAAAEHGCALDPGSAAALLTVAGVERDAGRPGPAMAAARAALARDPANAYGRWLVAMLYAEKLRVGRSMRGLREVARDNPARPDVISMTWPVRSLLSALRRWLAAATVLVALAALLTPWPVVARLAAATFAVVVAGFAARVLIPAGRTPWRSLLLIPRMPRRAVVVGLAAVTAMLVLLAGYAVTGRDLLAVLAVLLSPVLWAGGLAERLGVRLDDPGFRFALTDLRRQFAEFGAELRTWWATTRRELRETWNEK